MDKFRAMQYFVAAAQERSFTAAAHRLEVTTPAIAKLVTALEHDLGASLFVRTARGVTLTASGETYLEACEPLLQQLASADDAVAAAAIRPRGTLVIGAPSHIAQHCLLPAMFEFHARFPELQIDIRNVTTVADVESSGVEVSVLFGWFEVQGLVCRRVGQTRFVVCAAPSYWAAHGKPNRPVDLEQHSCLVYRVIGGTVDDLWRFERHGEKESAAVDGWLVSRHRDVVLDTALAGYGIARLMDLTISSHLQSGRLVPALTDWEVMDSPPVTVLTRPSHRRTPRVRYFIEFLDTLFDGYEARRSGRGSHRITEHPPWWGRRGRASGTVHRKE
jgi:LysR family transcriptional regulator for bpeEF and oprC